MKPVVARNSWGRLPAWLPPSGLESLALALLVSVGLPLAVRAQTTAGTIAGAETWSGTVTLTGDVKIVEGGQVTVLPGTVVRAQPRVDSQQGGQHADRIEIRVEGGVFQAEGTAAAPILLTSAAASPAPGDWTGLVVGFGTVTLRHVQEEHAHVGLNFLGGGDYVCNDTIWSRNESHGLSLGAAGAYEFTGLHAARNGGAGLLAVTATHLTLTDGVLEDNTGEGAVLAAHSVLENVRVERNASAGLAIYVGGGTHRWNAVSISDSGADGVYTSAFHQIIGTNCDISRNRRYGLVGQDGKLIELNNCRVLSNGSDGIGAFRVAAVRCTGGELRFNAGSGLQMDGVVEVSDLTISGNGAGLVLGYNPGFPGTAVVARCVISANAQEGIAVARPGRVESCDIRNNGVGVDVRWSDRTGAFEVTDNDLVGNPSGDLKNTGQCAVIARGNFFGTTTTQQLGAGEVNPTRIHGSLDDPAVGQVLVSTYLTSSRTNTAPELRTFVVPPLAGASQTLSGVLSGAHVWSGTILLTGDVEIPDGASVSVQPGTQIIASARRDDRAGGMDASRIELIVRGGSLTLNGTAAESISLKSAANEPVPGDWFGVVAEFGSVICRHTRQNYGAVGLSVVGGGDYVWEDTAWNRNSSRGVRVAFQGNYEFNQLSAEGNVGPGLVSELASTRLIVTDGAFAQNGSNSEASVQFAGSSTLTRVRVERGGGMGMRASGNGSSSNHQWDGVNVTDCAATGVDVRQFGRFTWVAGSTVRSGGPGLVCFGGNQVRLEECRFEANGGDGVQAAYLPTFELVGGTFRFNAGAGVHTDGEFNAVGAVFSNNGTGVSVIYNPAYPAAIASVENCTASANAGAGIYLSRDGSVKSSVIRNNGIGIQLDWWVADGVVEVTGCDLVGNPDAEVRIGSLASVAANGNYWGSVTTAELQQGRANLSRIWDQQDDPQVGRVTIQDWLSASIGTTTLSLTGQPQPQTVSVGELATFSVTATGPSPLTYRWRKGDTDLTDGGRVAGATTAQLSLSGIQPGDAGDYSVRVTAGNGATQLSEAARLTVLVPNQPPTVTLTAPHSGDSFTSPASIPLLANATDPDDGVAKVEFFANGNRLGESTAAPFGFPWANVPAGDYVLTARVTDRAGATADSAVVNVRVQEPAGNQPPTLAGLGDQFVTEGGSTGWIAFTIGDDTTPAGELLVTATSSHPAIVPNDWIALSGSSHERQILVRRLPKTTAPVEITVTVTDGNGQAIRQSFRVFVGDDPQPKLAADLHAVIRIPGVVGRTYRLEYRDSASADWHSLATITLQHSSQHFVDVSRASRAERSYRAVLLP